MSYVASLRVSLLALAACGGVSAISSSGQNTNAANWITKPKPGETVVAEATLTEDAVRRVLRTKLEDLEELAWAGTHGAVASGMQSVAFTPATAIAAIFAATGQDLGMVGTSSMCHGAERRVEDGLQVSLRLPGLEFTTIGGGTTLPFARRWLELLGCAGAGKVYRFAQLVAAATLALEISASAAMATAGSAEFFRAHHERGGLR